MKIQTTQIPRQLPQAAAPKQQAEPQEPWHQRTADYLERSNDVLTPKLAAFGMAAQFAAKGNQFTESLHPVSKAIGIVGGGLLGAAVGYFGGNTLQSVGSTVTDAVFGKETSLGKSLVSTGLNTAVFGLVGGWTGAGLHAAFTAGGAAALARHDLVQQG